MGRSCCVSISGRPQPPADAGFVTRRAQGGRGRRRAPTLTGPGVPQGIVLAPPLLLCGLHIQGDRAFSAVKIIYHNVRPNSLPHSPATPTKCASLSWHVLAPAAPLITIVASSRPSPTGVIRAALTRYTQHRVNVATYCDPISGNNYTRQATKHNKV